MKKVFGKFYNFDMINSDLIVCKITRIKIINFQFYSTYMLCCILEKKIACRITIEKKKRELHFFSSDQYVIVEHFQFYFITVLKMATNYVRGKKVINILFRVTISINRTKYHSKNLCQHFGKLIKCYKVGESSRPPLL